MKRTSAVIAFIICIALSTTAYADIYETLYKYSDSLYESGSVSADITVKNSGSFEFLSCLDEYIKPYSAAKIAEGIAGSRLHLDINYQTRKNRRILNAYIKAHAVSPITLNDDLSINADAVFHIWVNIDSTDSENPRHNITIKLPTSEKYYVLDSKFADRVSFYPSYLRTYTFKSGIESALRGNSRVTAAGNSYTVYMSDENLKGLFTCFADSSFKAIYSLFNGGRSSSEILSEGRESLMASLKRLEPIKVLGNAGLVHTLNFSEGGFLESSEMNIELDTNIFKLYYASTGKEMPTDPNAAKPAINADNSDVKMSISVSRTYSEEFNDFEYPQPSSDMMVDVYGIGKYSMTYTTDDKSNSPYETVSFTYSGFLQNDGETAYIPLRAALNSLGVNNSSIVWNEGNIFIEASVSLPFKSAAVTEGSCVVTKDGESVYLTKPPKSIDGVMYVPDDFFGKVLSAKILSCTTRPSGDLPGCSTTVLIERLKPVYFGREMFEISDY